MKDRREYYRAYYQRNKERKKAYARAWIKRNKARRAAWQKKYWQERGKLLDYLRREKDNEP